MGRCTGTATSTFGGGGGTKLFCSQALKAMEAIMAKAIRGAATACCERVSFIFPCPNRFSLANAFYSESGFRPSDKSSNNPLAVEPETENDIARGSYFAGSLMISIRLKRRL
jgi:hypothetical protein